MIGRIIAIISAVLVVIGACILGGVYIERIRDERDQYKEQLKERIDDDQEQDDIDDEDRIVDAMPERTVLDRTRKSAALRASIKAMRSKADNL